MELFLEEYRLGQPVVVYGPCGTPIGVPGAFLMFENGVSWADDGVLAVDYASHHTLHHLVGPIELSGGLVICEDHSFSPAPAWDPVIGSAWASGERLTNGSSSTTLSSTICEETGSELLAERRR